jgi:2'-5' RNA ligase
MKTETVLGIHINVRSDVAAAVKKLQKKHHLFYPGNYDLDPHLTLYLARFTRSDIAVLKKQLLRAKLQPVQLKIDRLRCQPFNSGVYSSLGIVRQPRLSQLHEQIVKMANALRGNRIRMKDLQRMREGQFSSAEVRTIKKYGYLRVGRRFHPHLTLGLSASLPDKYAQLKSAAYPLKGIGWTASKLIVGLYLYDYTRKDYVSVIREDEIPLGLEKDRLVC